MDANTIVQIASAIASQNTDQNLRQQAFSVQNQLESTNDSVQALLKTFPEVTNSIPAQNMILRIVAIRLNEHWAEFDPNFLQSFILPFFFIQLNSNQVQNYFTNSQTISIGNHIAKIQAIIAFNFFTQLFEQLFDYVKNFSDLHSVMFFTNFYTISSIPSLKNLDIIYNIHEIIIKNNFDSAFHDKIWALSQNIQSYLPQALMSYIKWGASFSSWFEDQNKFTLISNFLRQCNSNYINVLLATIQRLGKNSDQIFSILDINTLFQTFALILQPHDQQIGPDNTKAAIMLAKYLNYFITLNYTSPEISGYFNYVMQLFNFPAIEPSLALCPTVYNLITTYPNLAGQFLPSILERLVILMQMKKGLNLSEDPCVKKFVHLISTIILVSGEKKEELIQISTSQNFFDNLPLVMAFFAILAYSPSIDWNLKLDTFSNSFQNVLTIIGQIDSVTKFWALFYFFKAAASAKIPNLAPNSNDSYEQICRIVTDIFQKFVFAFPKLVNAGQTVGLLKVMKEFVSNMRAYIRLPAQSIVELLPSLAQSFGTSVDMCATIGIITTSETISSIVPPMLGNASNSITNNEDKITPINCVLTFISTLLTSQSSSSVAVAGQQTQQQGIAPEIAQQVYQFLEGLYPQILNNFIDETAGLYINCYVGLAPFFTEQINNKMNNEFLPRLLQLGKLSFDGNCRLLAAIMKNCQSDTSWANQTIFQLTSYYYTNILIENPINQDEADNLRKVAEGFCELLMQFFAKNKGNFDNVLKPMAEQISLVFVHGNTRKESLPILFETVGNIVAAGYPAQILVQDFFLQTISCVLDPNFDPTCYTYLEVIEALVGLHTLMVKAGAADEMKLKFQEALTLFGVSPVLIQQLDNYLQICAQGYLNNPFFTQFYNLLIVDRNTNQWVRASS